MKASNPKCPMAIQCLPGFPTCPTCKKGQTCVNRSGHGMTKKEKFMRHVNKTESCWLWLGSTYGNGYGRLVRKWKNIRAHRYSYELFTGPIPNNKLVCHSCDIKLCVNPSHLFVGTSHDNIQDAYNKGTMMGFRKKYGKALLRGCKGETK